MFTGLWTLALTIMADGAAHSGVRPSHTVTLSKRRPPNKPAGPLAVREDGGVVWSSDGAPFTHPVSCLLLAVSYNNEFSHFRQK